MILVTGAKGSVGREVVNQLHAASCEARALSRNENKAGLPEEVEVVIGDLTKHDSLSSVMEGTEVLSTVEEVTGQPSRTFNRWATDHIKAFQ